MSAVEESVALGRERRREGRLEEALALYMRAEDACRDSGDLLCLAHIVRHVGDIHWELGDADLAEPCFAEALEIYRANAPSPLDFANALRPMALLKEAAGAKEEAWELWGEAQALYETGGVAQGVEECAERRRALEASAGS